MLTCIFSSQPLIVFFFYYSSLGLWWDIAVCQKLTMKCCNFDTIIPGNDHFGVEDLEDQGYNDVHAFLLGGLKC